MTSDRDALLSERILHAMRDGVLAIDLSGRIITFNEAAGAILGKDPAVMLGRPFAEEFLLEERFDDFNNVVLKAVYEAEVAHSTDIVLAGGEGEDARNLRISSSFLTQIDEHDEIERFGVVVIFSDTTAERKRRKLKRLFGEYVDPRIVEEILARGDGEESRRGDMTISFVDMRDYTGWSERLDAASLTALLNRFLGAVTRPIGEAGGIFDKFIGDAAMASWGPPFTDPATQAVDALTAALEQVRAVEALRHTLVGEGFEGANGLDAVVAVATGDVLAGDIGPPSSRNFTVIGNAVNLAARLQELAKRYGAQIIVSDETRVRAGDRFVFQELDTVFVRGSRRPVRIHAVLGVPGSVAPERLDRARRFEAAARTLHAGKFDEAREAFLTLATSDPEDCASRLMLERAAAGAASPQPALLDTGGERKPL